MARVLLDDDLADVAGTGGCDVTSGDTTVQAALDSLLQQCPPLQPRMLDHEGRLRPDIAIFVQFALLRDADLQNVVPSDATLHIMRSGGPHVGMCWSTDWRHRRWSECRSIRTGRPETRLTGSPSGDRLGPLDHAAV